MVIAITLDNTLVYVAKMSVRTVRKNDKRRSNKHD